jgi:hypothetical protein
VVVVSTVPCKIPQDGRLKRQEARRDSGRIEAKRARIMSASGQEIVGPGFSSLTRVGVNQCGNTRD